MDYFMEMKYKCVVGTDVSMIYFFRNKAHFKWFECRIQLTNQLIQIQINKHHSSSSASSPSSSSLLVCILCSFKNALITYDQ